MWIGLPAIKVSIASEQTWKEGIIYRGFHLGTKNDELTGDYGWWSHGRVIDPKWLDTTRVIRVPLARIPIPSRRDLVRATLRDAHDPEKNLFLEEIRHRRPDTLLDLKRWRMKIWQRAVAKYGAGSEQAYLCSVEGSKPRPPGEGVPDKYNTAWVPSWETIMDLGRAEVDRPNSQPLFDKRECAPAGTPPNVSHHRYLSETSRRWDPRRHAQQVHQLR